MNKRQKVVVLAGVAVVALMLLLPPWRERSSYISTLPQPPGRRAAPSVSSVGYAPLFKPPGSDAFIDLPRLATQCGLVAVLTFGAYVVLGHKES